jgi:hypothetical protein
MLAPLLALAMLQPGTMPPKVGTGLFLYHSCQAALSLVEANKTDEELSRNYCLAYMQGWFDGTGTAHRGSCIPDSADAVSLVRVYVAYIVKHPEAMSDDRRIGLVLALADEYPCKTDR